MPSSNRDLDEALRISREALHRLEIVEKLAGENVRQISENSKQIAMILKWLRGNGERGYMTRVEDLEKFRQTFEHDQQEKLKDAKRVRFLIYAAIVTMAFNIGYLVFSKGMEASVDAKAFEQVEKQNKVLNEKFEQLLKKLDEKQ